MTEQTYFDSVDTEGYTLRRLPYWISPLTERSIYLDMYRMYEHRWELTLTDYYRFGRERQFTATPLLRIQGEFERNELIEQTDMFRIDLTKPTMLRTYIRRKYEMIELLPYTIIEKLELFKTLLTFSIETETTVPKGRDGQTASPFFAELEASTILPSGIEPRSTGEQYYLRRIVNCALKVFWIHFDGYKVVLKGMDALQRGMTEWLQYTQNFYETDMDEFIEALEEIIRSKDPDEFVTTQAIITIGVEYETVARALPQYPRVDILIEKVRTGRWTIDRTMIVADRTDIQLDEILGIMVNI